MKHRVALIEFSIFSQYPLLSGYLHAYAAADSALAAACEFVYYQKEVGRLDYPTVLQEVRALRARVVCLSAYVWNIGVVRRLITDLQADPQVQHIIVGGHQISHQIEKYVDRTDEKTIVVNGQGEIPFRAMLRQLVSERKIEPLRGISFYRDGELWNGGEAEMLTHLDDIPSPFLGGCFDDMDYPVAVFETNRGCPYKCTFCTWGGDTMRVTKFSLERIKEELFWLAKRSVLFLFLADANWGMLQRDIEISEYIARLRTLYGAPWGVYFAAAKNKPKGSIACIEKLHEGGVITSQALGIQSMNPLTLSLVDRENIKTSAFVEMFKQLSTRKIDSYCELIWPLPGETLETLQGGFEQLLQLGARTILMYPAVLINNAKLTEQIREFEMEYVDSSEWMSELKIVKATRYADRAAVESGFWFYYGYFLLGNLDFHKAIVRYLHTSTGRPYARIVADFAEYLRSHLDNSSYAQAIEDIFKNEAHGTLLTIGRIATHLTYERRFEAIADLACFVLRSETSTWPRELALVSLWALSLPKVFSNTDSRLESLVELLDELGSERGTSFSSIASVQQRAEELVISVDDTTGVWRDVVTFFGVEPDGVVSRIEIRHPTGPLPYDPHDYIKNLQYAHGMIERMTYIAPEIRVITRSAQQPPGHRTMNGSVTDDGCCAS
jgi:radical SAM superfamily enzyme YgiQ (UPF0313 family)